MSNDEGMTKSEDRKTSADESFWYNDAESMVREEPEKPRVYDLEERTARFGEAVIDFAKTIPQNPVTNRLISQLVGAGNECWRQLRRSRRCSVKERIFEVHWDVQERSA